MSSNEVVVGTSLAMMTILVLRPRLRADAGYATLGSVVYFYRSYPVDSQSSRNESKLLRQIDEADDAAGQRASASSSVPRVIDTMITER